MNNGLSEATFFDTDMHLHKISTDYNVREASDHLFIINHPSASSEFSLVELKGNYISSLILLRRKVNDSESIGMAFTRAVNTGGRKTKMMLLHLIRWIDEDERCESWEETKRLLITHLDAQIASSWEMFKNHVDFITSNINCTRAKEEPEDNNGRWSATIHRCTKGNSSCKIQEFILNHKSDLIKLNDKIRSLKKDKITPELRKIKNAIENILKKEQFNWEGNSCRRIGDLIIALDCKRGKKLITSNYKEHEILSKALGYDCEIFNYSQIRSK